MTKEVKLVESSKSGINVLGVQTVKGKNVELHVKVNGVDILAHLDASTVEVSYTCDEGEK